VVVDWEIPVAVGTADEPGTAHEPAAPQDAGLVPWRVQGLPFRAFLGALGIGVRRRETPRPLPTVTAHLLAAIGARPAGKDTDGAGRADARVGIVGRVNVGVAAPGIAALGLLVQCKRVS
jgi:hypothetical protein